MNASKEAFVIEVKNKSDQEFIHCSRRGGDEIPQLT